MEHWTVVEWCAVIGAVVVVAGALGSAITTFFHGWRARERMFQRIEAVEKLQGSDHRKVMLLWDARDRDVPGLGTQTGIRDDED